MKIEIWSDVMCPFCYIGKRRFENALQQFENKDKVEVVWKSFQLDPDLQTTGKHINEYLAERKGWTVGYANQMNSHVTQMAADEGLSYDFDKAVVANTFDAHRFAHYAASKQKGDIAEESLFNAYFTQGKNIADHATLAELGKSIGLDAKETKDILAGNAFTEEVHYDIKEAVEIGVRGVPFFVIDRKYAISGAQPEEVFTQTFRKAFAEWKEIKANDKLPVADGTVCDVDGNCE